MRTSSLAGLAVLAAAAPAAAQSGATLNIPASPGHPARTIDISGGLYVDLGGARPTPAPEPEPVAAPTAASAPLAAPVPPLQAEPRREPDWLAELKLDPASRPIPALGAAPLRAPVLTARLLPARTGVLAQPIRGRLGSGQRDIAAGAPVYGVTLGDRFFWCAPALDASDVTFLLRATDCVYQAKAAWARTSTFDQAFVTRITTGSSDPAVATPAVVEEPVAFPAFSVGYFVKAWTGPAVIVEMAELADSDAAGGSQPIGCPISAPRAADGDAILTVFGLAYRLRASDDDKATTVAFLGPATAAQEASQQPLDCLARHRPTGYRTASASHARSKARR